jgi:cytochrome c oxidase subunit 2
MQSALHPAGPAAEAIGSLTLVLSVVAAAVLGLVMALLVAGVRQDSRPVRTGLWVVGGGIVFPTLVLSGLLSYSTRLTGALTAPPEADALPVEIDARQWWWEIRYPRNAGQAPVITANELHIPVGRSVELLLTTADVIHSFWTPRLAGKVDMVPGRVNRLALRADRPGVYRGQCAEFCGVQHARMALLVVAESAEAFQAWLEREAGMARPPSNPLLEEGLEAFLAEGCGGCHAIRGTPADGRLGPDLTHVGSRRSLGAATLDNHLGALTAWIAASQQIKPGNAMPDFDLEGPRLRAIAAYLADLE